MFVFKFSPGGIARKDENVNMNEQKKGMVHAGAGSRRVPIDKAKAFHSRAMRTFRCGKH